MIFFFLYIELKNDFFKLTEGYPPRPVSGFMEMWRIYGENEETHMEKVKNLTEKGK